MKNVEYRIIKDGPGFYRAQKRVRCFLGFWSRWKRIAMSRVSVERAKADVDSDKGVVIWTDSPAPGANGEG